MDGRNKLRMSKRLASGVENGKNANKRDKVSKGEREKKVTNYLEGPEPKYPMDLSMGGAMIEVVTRREDRSGIQSFCCETKNSLEWRARVLTITRMSVAKAPVRA